MDKVKLKFSLITCLLIIAYIFGLSPAKAVNKSSPDIWFDDLQNALEISELDGKALTQSVAESIYNGRKKINKMPTALKHDDSPRIVFLSVSDGETPAHVVLGMDRGIKQAIELAINKIQATLPSEYNPILIKVDIVQNVFPEQKAQANTPLDFERSLSGIAFKRGTGLAFLPQELMANNLVNRRQEVSPRNISKYLEEKPILHEAFNDLKELDSFEIMRFTVDSYFYDGKQAFQLFRGHRIFKQTSAEELLNVAKEAGNYLRNSVHPDGSFIYSYFPKTGEIPNEYNILRHAGTVYSMLELYKITGDEELLQTIQRAINYLIESIKPCQIGSESFACVVEDGNVKLGGNALAAVALTKYIDITKDDKNLPVLIKLVKWIQAIQRKSGEFYPHKQTYPDGKASGLISRYYPGEALLALVRFHALQPDQSYLDTAERGAQYLINVRDKDLTISELNHDHWLLYALNELYRYRPNTLYLNHSMKIAKAIVKSQNRSPVYSDWFGSYSQPPSSTPSATRSEGLYAAYQLARDFGHPVEAQQILITLQNAIGFQLQTQFRPESAMYLNNSKQILGGFHENLTEYEIRIDYVQHNISSIIGLYRIKNEKDEKNENIDFSKETTDKLKFLFVGDTSFGENYQIKIKKNGGQNILETKGYDYLFEKIKPILLNSDFVIANLETPITDLAKSPLDGRKKYIHWTDSKQAPNYLTSYNINAVTLANNHTLDFGVEGMKQTLDVLNRSNIEWFGAGFNEDEAKKPYIKEFKIGQKFFRLAVIGAFEYREKYNSDYNFYANKKVGGVNSLSIEKISKQIREIKNVDPDTFVIVFPHWGGNYRWKTNSQSELAHQIIDAGADLIIGHGAHMMQEVEKYRGNWIIYNIGNFIFNSKGRYKKYKVEPFSLLVQFVLIQNSSGIEKILRLYPILTDNMITNYQSRFLTKDEFDEAYLLLLEKSGDNLQFHKDIRIGKDDIGRFMELSM